MRRLTLFQQLVHKKFDVDVGVQVAPRAAIRPLQTAIGGSSVGFAMHSEQSHRFFSVATDHPGNIEAVTDVAELVVSNEAVDGAKVPVPSRCTRAIRIRSTPRRGSRSIFQCRRNSI
jgi:hypothetical protein